MRPRTQTTPKNSHHARIRLCLAPSPGHKTKAVAFLIEQGVNDSQLQSERIAVGAILLFFVSVKSFKTNAQAFPNLPDQVQARVMRHMICMRALREFVVQVHVAIARGRAEDVVPLMSETDHPAERGDRC